MKSVIKCFAMMLMALCAIGASAQDAKTGSSKVSKGESTEKVYDSVDVPSQFPGGDKALNDYIAQNIVYPKEALEKGLQGMVMVQAVIRSDGSVGDMKILRGRNELLDKEALRVVSSLPRFTPGTQLGTPVNVKYVIPVRFKLPTR